MTSAHGSAAEGHPPRRRSPLRRLVATVVGVLIAFALLEGALAVMSLFYAAEPRAQHPREGEIDAEIAAGARRILCVGDSNTYGIHLEPHESYPAQLEALLAGAPDGPWRVFNHGKWGRNSAESRYYLVDQLERLRPDVVIVWTGVNTSWSRSMGHLWSLPDREEPPPALAFVEYLRTVRMVRVLFDKPAPRPYDRVQPIEAVAADPWGGGAPFESGPGRDELVRRLTLDLTRIRALCDAAGARLLLLDYPYRVPHLRYAVNPAIRAFAESSGTAHLSLAADLMPRIEALGLEAHMFEDYHLKAAANGEVARLVASAMAERGWVEGGSWLDVPPLESGRARVGLLLEAGEGGLRAELTGPPGAEAHATAEPLVLRAGADQAEELTGRELASQTAERVWWRDRVGALSREGRTSFVVPLPSAPSGLDAAPFEPGTEFWGWRVRGAVRIDGALVASPHRFVTRDGRVAELPTRAAR